MPMTRITKRRSRDAVQWLRAERAAQAQRVAAQAGVLDGSVARRTRALEAYVQRLAVTGLHVHDGAHERVRLEELPAVGDRR
jgi:hypothetical protein